MVTHQNIEPSSGDLGDSSVYLMARVCLQVLHLQGNGITGTVPAAWATANLPNLAELFLGLNNMSGSLPSQWGKPNALPSLQVCGCQLPASVCSCFKDVECVRFLVHALHCGSLADAGLVQV